MWNHMNLKLSSARLAFPTGVAEDLLPTCVFIEILFQDKMYSHILLPRHMCSQAVFCTELFHNGMNKHQAAALCAV